MPAVRSVVSTLAWVSILGTAVGLRLWGITWGSPRFDLNPDELLVLRIASGLTWEDPNPHFFSYSGFVFHQSFLTTEFLKLFGVELVDFSRILMHRLWSVFWGVLTVALVFQIARQLGSSRRAALLATAFMAVAPLHVWETHFGTTDSPLLFWMAASVLVSLWAYDQPTPRLAALAGLLAGFAVGTKYPGAFVGVPFVVAMALAALDRRLPGWWPATGRTVVFGLAAIAGSFMVSPFTYLQAFEAVTTVDPRRDSSIAAFLFEYNAMQAGVFGFDLHAPGWQYRPYLYEVGAMWPFSFGLALYLLVLGGIVAFVRRLERKRLIVLAFMVAYFAVTGSWQFSPLRYTLPIYPFLLVMAALFLDDLFTRRRLIGAVVGSLVVAYTIGLTASTTSRFTDDTRLQAAAWAERWLNTGSAVLMVHTRAPYSYVPRLDRTKFRSPVVRLQTLDTTVRDYRRRLPKGGPGAPTVYLCASSMDYVRYYRSGVPESVDAWDQVRANPSVYRPIKTFEASFLNQSFYQKLDPMFASYFVSPRIEFYEFVQ
jgi:4-amino-4-deoxy-L-arabinose transferase-like glycosyltransferase